MTRKEQIKSAYKLTGSNASFYDGMMTYSTLPGKAICRIVWNSDASAAGNSARRRQDTIWLEKILNIKRNP